MGYRIKYVVLNDLKVYYYLGDEIWKKPRLRMQVIFTEKHILTWQKLEEACEMQIRRKLEVF